MGVPALSYLFADHLVRSGTKQPNLCNEVPGCSWCPPDEEEHLGVLFSFLAPAKPQLPRLSLPYQCNKSLSFRIHQYDPCASTHTYSLLSRTHPPKAVRQSRSKCYRNLRFARYFAIIAMDYHHSATHLAI